MYNENMKENESLTRSGKKKSSVIKRIFFVLIVMLILGLSLALISMPFYYNVQKNIIRAVCTPFLVSQPEGYDEIVKRLNIQRDIAYSTEFERGYMDIISPKDTNEALPLVVYIHGGYYVGGDKASSEPYCAMIADEGYIVANINYTLAPDGKYPTQLIQANEAIKYLMENAESYNIDQNNIFIGGDSAGAHLSSQLGVFYTNAEFASTIGVEPAILSSNLKGVILLCGFYDALNLRKVKFPFLHDALWMLTGEKKYEEYDKINELNIIANIDENYPSTYLLCGHNDPFYPQNLEFKDVLDSKNISVTSYLPNTSNKRLRHEFQRDFRLEEAYHAMDLLINFLDNHKE